MPIVNLHGLTLDVEIHYAHTTPSTQHANGYSELEWTCTHATDEIGEAMDEVRKKNNDPTYKGQPGRTLATQQNKAQEQLDLVTRYEQMLGLTLEELREEISKLNWNITVADVSGM